MNRPIRFRTWNGEQMISPDYIDREGLAWWKENSIPESSKELMQFTGLLDKNGKEIYEGDILRLDAWDKPQQIRFIEGAFCLADKEGHYTGDIHYIQHADIPQSTVMGNIYENPELLS